MSGIVARLSADSGSAFALLPSQNASSSWIKIVQRLPVPIAPDSAQLQEHPLRVRLSMHAAIEVRDTSSPLIANQVCKSPITSASLCW